MDLATRKNRLIESFEKIKDVKLIERIELFLKNEIAQERDVVAYATDGKPLSVNEYREEIVKGIDDIKKGRTISDDDLAKEIESW